MQMPRDKQLRVWWIPQVPMEPFYVSVNNLAEARLILDTLANYDQFQYDNKIKPDYCNAGGLSIWLEDIDADEDGSKWCNWEDEETGESFDEYCNNLEVR